MLYIKGSEGYYRSLLCPNLGWQEARKSSMTSGRVPRRDTGILMGDRKQVHNEESIGKRNDNGELFTIFC